MPRELEPEEPDEEEPEDFEPEEPDEEEPDEEEPEEPEEPEDFEPEEDMLPLPWGPPEPAPEEPDEDWLAPRLTALEDPDSRSLELLAGGDAWLAGVCLAEELFEEPSSLLLEDFEDEPPSETTASAESASPSAASPPSRAVNDLTGRRARSSSGGPSRSIAVGSSVVVRTFMACLPAR